MATPGVRSRTCSARPTSSLVFNAESRGGRLPAFLCAPVNHSAGRHSIAKPEFPALTDVLPIGDQDRFRQRSQESAAESRSCDDVHPNHHVLLCSSALMRWALPYAQSQLRLLPVPCLSCGAPWPSPRTRAAPLDRQAISSPDNVANARVERQIDLLESSGLEAGKRAYACKLLAEI